jgi:hypothetical protein
VPECLGDDHAFIPQAKKILEWTASPEEAIEVGDHTVHCLQC